MQIFSASDEEPSPWTVRTSGSWFQTQISTIRDLLDFNDYRYQLVRFRASYRQCRHWLSRWKYRQTRHSVRGRRRMASHRHHSAGR